MKKIYVSCDMEGITGICSNRHRELGDSFYEWGRKLMTRELNTVIDSLLNKEVEEIVVNDSHDYMINLHIDELPPNVALISGSHKTDSMMEGVTPEFDGAVFIGYHGKCGLSNSVLSHTYSDSIARITINGLWAGETTLNAAFCGEKSVPVLLVSGDDKVAEEVTELNTQTKSVITKLGISRSAGMMYHPERIEKEYQKKIDEVFTTNIKPFKIESPYILDVTLRETQMVDIALRIPGTKRINHSTLRFEADDYIVTYRAFIAIQTIASASYLK